MAVAFTSASAAWLRAACPIRPPKVLVPLQQAFPNLRIQLTEGQTVNISRMLKHGELDATLLALPVGEEPSM